MLGYELILTESGTCILQSDESDDAEMLWSSDGDDDFAEEFGELIESEDLNDVAAWLVDEGYIPPRVSITITDETVEPGEESGWFEKLPIDPEGDDDEDEGDSGDDEEEDES